jgi:hypothetical protein
VLALLRDGPEWRPPQDAARCRRLALELGYFGLDSAALDAALAPPAPQPPVPAPGHIIVTFGGATHEQDENSSMNFMIDTASGGASVVNLGVGVFVDDSVAALPDGRVLVWNRSTDQHGFCTRVLHLGEGLDHTGRPRRVSVAAPAYGGLLSADINHGHQLISGTGATVGGRAMCFGGQLEPYDDYAGLPTTQWFDEGVGRWFEGPRMPEPDAQPGVAEHGGCALVLLSDALWRYDPRAPAWASMAPPNARVPSVAAVAAVGDRLLVISGNISPMPCFDVRAGRWEEAGAAGAPPPLPQLKTPFLGGDGRLGGVVRRRHRVHRRPQLRRCLQRRHQCMAPGGRAAGRVALPDVSQQRRLLPQALLRPAMRQSCQTRWRWRCRRRERDEAGCSGGAPAPTAAPETGERIARQLSVGVDW